jgi:hypothetical protein
MFFCCAKPRSSTERYLSDIENVARATNENGFTPVAQEIQEAEEFFQRQREASSLALDAVARRATLRTFHSLLATSLYVFFAWSCIPKEVEGMEKLVVGLILVLPMATAYNLLSFNKAGVYYANSVEMLTRLPHHIVAFSRRHGDQYEDCLEEERNLHIFRTVDALETSALFLIVFFLQVEVPTQQWVHDVQALLLDSFWLSLPHPVVRRALWALLFFLLHRTWGANVLQGKCHGLMQPSGMWKFISSGAAASGCVICGMTPCLNRQLL